MPKKIINETNLLCRSAFFIDGLRFSTGLGFKALEERIRLNQYAANRLSPPQEETVRDYFRLYRSVAFEPRVPVPGKSKNYCAPWLLAAELEFEGSSFNFFYPLFDLLFGRMESSLYWYAHFNKIPQSWIDEEKRKGNDELANEWRAMNIAVQRRLHRTKPTDDLDALSFIHLSMMRLPEPVGSILFQTEEVAQEAKGIAHMRSRRFLPAQEEVDHLSSFRSLDALAGLFAVVKESAHIGDVQRFNFAKAAVIKNLPVIEADPACKRINSQLKKSICMDLESKPNIRKYSRIFHHGLVLPTSWRAQLGSPMFDDILKNSEDTRRQDLADFFGFDVIEKIRDV